MYWEQFIQCEAGTDIGLRRKNNEDSYCIHLCPDESQWRRTGHLLLVADGMGGHAVGELASRIAAETVPHAFLKGPDAGPATLLHDAIISANKAIYERGTQNADFLHMGTTCTALVLCSRGALVGHVGDSRAYRVRRDRIDQLTFDHSLEWELERQHGSLDGILDLSQHKNIITRSLGPEKQVEVDIEGPFPVLPGDTFVLCSDGLSNLVADAEIGAIVRELAPAQAVRLLLHLANIRGGPDNSTVVVARSGDLPANLAPVPNDEGTDSQFGLGWSWLIGLWVLAMGLVAGIAMQWLGHPIKGHVLVAVCASGLLALLAASFRQRRAHRTSDLEESHTRLWRPHRTAVGMSSRTLLDMLMQTDIELQRSAREDGWDVDWKEHDQAVSAAQEANHEKRYAKGIRDMARAIGKIMEELPRRGGFRVGTDANTPANATEGPGSGNQNSTSS